MTPVLLRTIAVLGVWAVALGAAIASGASPRPAELIAAVGAGATLILWGLLGDRPARGRVPLEPRETATPPPRERDAV